MPVVPGTAGFVCSLAHPTFHNTGVPEFPGLELRGFNVFIVKVNHSCYAPWSPKVSRVSRGFFSWQLTSFVILSLFPHVSFGFKRIGDGEAM